MVNRHRIDVDTLSNQIRYVSREGSLEGDRPVTFLRLFNLTHASQKGVEIAGWGPWKKTPT